MRAQILDCDYVLVDGKPIIRVFGKTPIGKTICVFVEKFNPYMYLDLDDWNDLKDVVYELEKNNIESESVERIIPTGFHQKKTVLKLSAADPGKIPEIKAFVKQWGVPYEADILFKYRFLIDHKLKGMGWFEFEGKQIQTRSVSCDCFRADSIKPLEMIENSPLKYMSID